jgi:hypothetical protein
VDRANVEKVQLNDFERNAATDAYMKRELELWNRFIGKSKEVKMIKKALCNVEQGHLQEGKIFEDWMLKHRSDSCKKQTILRSSDAIVAEFTSIDDSLFDGFDDEFSVQRAEQFMRTELEIELAQIWKSFLGAPRFESNECDLRRITDKRCWNILKAFKFHARKYRAERWNQLVNLMADLKWRELSKDEKEAKKQALLNTSGQILDASLADFTSKANIFHTTCALGLTNQESVIDRDRFLLKFHTAVFETLDTELMTQMMNVLKLQV